METESTQAESRSLKRSGSTASRASQRLASPRNEALDSISEELQRPEVETGKQRQGANVSDRNPPSATMKAESTNVGRPALAPIKKQENKDFVDIALTQLDGNDPESPSSRDFEKPRYVSSQSYILPTFEDKATNFSDSIKQNPLDNVGGDGVQYRNMRWWQAGMLMVAETISLGILSLPAALSVLGLIPGLVLLAVLGAMASYTGYVIGQFKIKHPHVQSFGDAGEILFGAVGREVFGFGGLLFIVFVMASHVLTFSIMMNAISSHAACTIIWMVVGTILSLALTLPRTRGNLSHYCIASFISVIGAVFITMVGVGITKPGFAPGTNISSYSLFPAPNIEFHKGFAAVSNIIFAYAGHVAFFGFISEMREPTDFPKALALLQTSDILMYILSAVVIYFFAGDTVKSPALDSASPIVRKVAYGVAMPTIVIAGVVNGHVAVKYLYVRLLKNRKDNMMHQRTFKAYGIWALICSVLWLLAWVIGEGVPVFHDLLGLSSALFASWFTYGLSGMFWLHMNMERKGRRITLKNGWTWEKMVAFAVSCLNVLVGATICVVGLYTSGKSIAISNVTIQPFSCADNSNVSFFKSD